jgi:hypothetical protein
METTREIPTSQWKATLNRFSARNYGRLARLEVSVAAGEGEPVIAEHRPFFGAALETKGSGAPAITVTLGGLDPTPAQSEHTIGSPERIWTQEELDGLAIALEVQSYKEGKTLLSFEPEAALPQ